MFIVKYCHFKDVVCSQILWKRIICTINTAKLLEQSYEKEKQRKSQSIDVKSNLTDSPLDIVLS